jgi:hypothetical protein
MEQAKEYKIIDWAYNRMFSDKTFKCIDSAFDFLLSKFEDDELQDIFIVDISTRCFANGYWSSSN